MSGINREKLLAWAFGSVFSAEDQALLAAIAKGEDGIALPAEAVDESEEMSENNMYNLIKDMSIPQKIKLALFGNQTARSILLRESQNRQIPLLVLQNPRITDMELLEIAKNTNSEDFVLRELGGDSQRMRTYPMKVAIVSNPKVPVDVSARWIKYLQDKDLRRIARSKNVPQLISSQCRKLLEKREVG